MSKYDEMLEDFKKWVSTDKKAQALWEKIKQGKANWMDAKRYAIAIGGKWSDLLEDKFADVEDFREYVEDIQKSLKKAYSESAYYSKSVQQITNDDANIGIKVVEPRADQERIENFTNKLIEGSALWLLGSDAIGSITESAISDTIGTNARIQSDFGIKAYIERDTQGKCCEWCESLAGRYVYGQEPKEFYQTHKDCSCVFTYSPVKIRGRR
ncbi:MAG: hypothetical protein MJZ34_13610 [Paludibacteraceae bacterium]|nr:hypothetical protein [Paludibacteraceae bacterium]